MGNIIRYWILAGLVCSLPVWANEKDMIPVNLYKLQSVDDLSAYEFSGKVEEKGHNVVSLQTYTVKVPLPPYVLAYISTHQAAVIELPFSRTRRQSSKVLKVSPDGVETTVRALSNTIDGMRLKVRFPRLKVPLLRIPFEAILNPTGLKYQVYVVDEGRAKQVSINPIILEEGAALVGSQDFAYSQVVLNPVNKLYPERLVEVQP